MTDHTVKAYDRELGTLGRRIAEMGGLAEQMLSLGVLTGRLCAPSETAVPGAGYDAVCAIDDQ